MKKYINVIASFDTTGNITPIKIIWDDESSFKIDRISEIRPAVSLKAGGAGMRYTCFIHGHQRYVFFERGLWYVESKD